MMSRALLWCSSAALAWPRPSNSQPERLPWPELRPPCGSALAFRARQTLLLKSTRRSPRPEKCLAPRPRKPGPRAKRSLSNKRSPWLRALFDLDDFVGHQTVGFSVHRYGGLATRRPAQAEDFAGCLVVPVPEEFDAVFILNGEILLMSRRDRLGREARYVVMNIHEKRHCFPLRAAPIFREEQITLANSSRLTLYTIGGVAFARRLIPRPASVGRG